LTHPVPATPEETTMKRATPYLFFPGHTEEAFAYYAGVSRSASVRADEGVGAAGVAAFEGASGVPVV
jgi:hypothetical protein